MGRLLRDSWFQVFLAVAAGALAGWGAFHLGERYELAEAMRTSPHDGQDGMSILGAGIVACVVSFFGALVMVLGLLRLLKEPAE